MVEFSRIFKFLAGLNVEFDEVRGRIIGRQPLPSIGEIFSEVRRDDVATNSFENSALIIAAASRNITSEHKIDKKSWVWCDFCNKLRHTRQTYWKIHGKLAD